MRHFLSKWHRRLYLYLPLIVFTPLIFVLSLTAGSELGLKTSVALGLGGIFAWTLIEYLLHRFAFHYRARSTWGKKMVLFFHGYHHQAPAETRRAVLTMSVPGALFLYALLWIFFPLPYAHLLFSGIISGYLVYDGLHYAVHHWPLQNRTGRFLKTYHLKHHASDTKNRFGVTSPFWDWAFGTYAKDSK